MLHFPSGRGREKVKPLRFGRGLITSDYVQKSTTTSNPPKEYTASIPVTRKIDVQLIGDTEIVIKLEPTIDEGPRELKGIIMTR
jgi:hypothetical protein